MYANKNVPSQASLSPPTKTRCEVKPSVRRAERCALGYNLDLGRPNCKKVIFPRNGYLSWHLL